MSLPPPPALPLTCCRRATTQLLTRIAPFFYHGVRTTPASPVTREVAAELSQYLTVRNESYALALARRSISRIIFLYLVLRSEYTAHRASINSNKSDFECFLDLLPGKLGPVGAKLVKQARDKNAQHDVLITQVSRTAFKKKSFSELIAHLPHKEFHKCVSRYHNGAKPRKFSYWDQYLAMTFAQLTYRESLRDIEACLGSVTGKLFHLGFRGDVARSTLADANETRDWRIFADFAQVLIGIAQPLYADDPLGVDLDHSLYALDSTTIDLCLALFPWAKFRKHKAAVKMHTMLDLHGNIPTFIRISDGKLSDVKVLDDIAIEAGAFYVFDRGYLDFARLYRFTRSSAFFVTRTKKNVVLRRRYSHAVDKSTGVRSDQTVILGTAESAHAYPEILRLVSYVAPETNKRLKILTNNFTLPALTIAQIYKCR